MSKGKQIQTLELVEKESYCKKNVRLNQLADALYEDKKRKVDFISTINKNNLVVKQDHLGVWNDDKGHFEDLKMTQTGLRGLCQNLDIPYRFLEDVPPDLASDIIKFRADQYEGKRLLFRTDEVVVLNSVHSRNYVVYDNHDLIDDSFDKLKKINKKIHNINVTPERLYLKMLLGSEDDNEELRSGLVLSNSEIGMGSIQVLPFIFRLPCTNDATFHQNIFKKKHFGSNSRSDILDNISNVIDSALEKSEKEKQFLYELRRKQIKFPINFIDNLNASLLNIPKHQSIDIKDAFRIEPENNLFGVFNAYTRYAQQLPVDKRIKMEQIATKISKLRNTKVFDYEEIY